MGESHKEGVRGMTDKEKLALRQKVCEEILSYGESNQEVTDLTLTLDRIFTAFELAGYLPVEEVEFEGLTDEELRKSVYPTHTIELAIDIGDRVEQSTISKIKQQGKLYRMKE
jgi:hypothetical protein